MIEVFYERLMLYYEKVTCQKQGQKQCWVSTFAWIKPFYFFKITLIWDHRVQNTQSEVFLCKNELFILFIYLLIFDQIIHSRSRYGVVYSFSNKS